MAGQAFAVEEPEVVGGHQADGSMIGEATSEEEEEEEDEESADIIIVRRIGN